MQTRDLLQLCLRELAPFADDAQTVRGELTQKAPGREWGDHGHLIDLLYSFRGNTGVFGDGGK